MSDVIRLQLETRNLLIRFEYAFCGLIFGILAFSIQFSPNTHKNCLSVLIIGWMLLLIAGIVSGWRLFFLGEFSHLDSLRFREAERKSNKENFVADPNISNFLRLGRVLDPTTGKKWNEEDLKNDIQMVGNNVELLKSVQVDLNRKLSCLFKLQVFCFSAGMICLAIFSSINLILLN